MLRKLKRHVRNLAENPSKYNILGRLLLLAYKAYRHCLALLFRSDSPAAAKLYIRTKNAERALRSQSTFVTLDELFRWTSEWTRTFQDDYAVVVGIPRAGLLIAATIALKLGKPLSTPEEFSQGHLWMSTHGEYDITSFGSSYNVLLVDDNIDTGESLERAADILLTANRSLKITKAVLMVSSRSAKRVDMYYKVLPFCPPVGEWKLLTRKRGVLAVDMDGVLCEDCSIEIDGNEESYMEWLREAKPYLVPRFEIDCIVSNRLERYRSETEEWLARHGVSYRRLFLWDIPSKAERKGRFVEHKREVLLKIKPSEYWESSYEEAKAIWEGTRIPTICIGEMIAFGSLPNW